MEGKNVLGGWKGDFFFLSWSALLLSVYTLLGQLSVQFYKPI